MANTIACECGEELTIPQTRGAKPVKCPACGARVTPPAGKRRSSGDSRESADGAQEGATRKRPKPFVATYSSMARSMVYRGYAFPDAVLLLEFAAFNIFTGFDIAREGKSKNWAVNLLDGVHGIVGALTGMTAFTVAAVLTRIVLRAASDNLKDAGDMVGVLIFAFGLALFIFLLAVFGATFQARKRAAQIDAMTDDELHAEAESNKRNVAIRPGEVKKVTIDPPPASDLAKNFVATLKFETDAGKWKFLLPTRRDLKALVKGLRAVLDEKQLSIAVEAGMD